MKTHVDFLDRMLTAAAWLAAALCVAAAFLGARRAEALFTSPPALIAAGLLALCLGWRCVLALHAATFSAALTYLGAVFILGGGLWGTPTVVRRLSDVTGRELPRKGYLITDSAGPNSTLVRTIGGAPGPLPFAVRLRSFEIEHYDAASDNHTPRVRSMTARVDILESNVVVRSASLEINRPLYHAGYHLYLHSHGMDNGGRVVLLYARHARGLWFIYTGMACLTAGIVWWAWNPACLVKPGSLWPIHADIGRNMG